MTTWLCLTHGEKENNMTVIQKLDASLQWQTVEQTRDAYDGMKKLQRRGAKLGWKFIKDESLYGGYYADQNGDCFRVA
jgi:hypothetical protein